MAGIQMSGLASGMDTAALISQLMQVERLPRARMERQQAAVQQRQDVLKELNTKLKALKNAATDLNSPALWTPKQNLTTSDATRVGARIVGTTPIAAGTYDVVVQNLATTESETWSTRTRPISTTLTFTNASGATTDVTIPANSTVDGVAAAINAAAGAPVTAVNDNGALRLVSKTMGAPGTFSVSGFALDARAAERVGVDANFTVNGVAHKTSNNVNSTAIDGAELSLVGLTAPGVPVSITVTQSQVDKAAITAKAKSFVDAYNAVVDFARSKLAEKPNPKAATMTEAKVGVLYGDRGVTQVLSQLRTALMDPVPGNVGTQDELHEIGISTGVAVTTVQQDKVAGRLTFDEAKFTAAWDSNRVDVEKLLRGDGVTGGFVQRMDGLLKPLVDVGGTFDGRITATQSQLKTFTESLGRIDRRLERKEEFYRRQFTTLETALQRAQSMQTEMSGQLAGLNSNNK
jgi:flagellar hook-associated protein 2